VKRIITILQMTIMHKGAIIGIIVVVVAVGGLLASPLFYETEIDEPLPVVLDKIEPGLTLTKFSNMDDTPRQVLVEKMPDKVKEMVMEEATKMPTSVSEGMDMMGNTQSVAIVKSGNFEGLAGHYAEGLAKIIEVEGATFLRFEDFEVTNGPDLRVYITKDGDIKNGIHLEKLKGSKGNQNYELNDIDVAQYNSVVIYCQPFGVYFGQAQLT
jgi:hypothetical protein